MAIIYKLSKDFANIVLMFQNTFWNLTKDIRRPPKVAVVDPKMFRLLRYGYPALRLNKLTKWNEYHYYFGIDLNWKVAHFTKHFI